MFERSVALSGQLTCEVSRGTNREDVPVRLEPLREKVVTIPVLECQLSGRHGDRQVTAG
jgi:hypothetical protein